MNSNLNWETGIYQALDKGNGEDVFRVTVAADWGALWDYEQMMQEDALTVYGDLLPLFRNSNLNIVNIECALGTKGEPIPKGGPNLRSAEGTIRCLTEVPFHVGCLANNHSMDFGPESLQETITLLNKANLKTVGAGMNGAEAANPLIIEIGNATLGIINCAEGESCASIEGGPGANPFFVETLIMQVHELKKRVGAVLVIFHGGREMAPLPPPYLVDGLRRLADAGACAIVSHHAHVPQPVEIHNGVPIAYSLGNFVFRWDERDSNFYAPNTGYLVHLDFVGSDLVSFSLTPYRTKLNGVYTLQGEEKALLLSELKYLSELLSNPTRVREVWDAFVDVQGSEGMMGTLDLLMNMAESEIEKSSAIFHNLFYSPAHRELYLNGMRRLSQGKLGSSPQWAQELVRDWATRPM